MKRIFLLVMAATLTVGAFAKDKHKKPDSKKCTQTHCTQQCPKECSKSSCCTKS